MNETPADLEKEHPPADDPFWQESWYFNFADADRNVYGLTRIGYRPYRNRADGLLLASVNGRPALLYPALGKKLSSSAVAIRPPHQLRTGGLCFVCRSPMEEWRLSLKTRRVDLELTYSCETPPYFYPEVAMETGPSAAASHYEQAGRVSGRIRFGGTDLPVSGRGQRDHSWGPRHWAGVGSWTWISAQFESGWAFNYWRLGSGPPEKTCGFIADNRATRDLAGGEIEWQGDLKGRRPSGARMELVIADGSHKTIAFTAAAWWPLYKDGAMLTETFGVCSCDGEKGVGVIERLFIPWLGPMALIPHVPKMAAMALYSM